jgi:hypothetical protein
MSRITQTRGLAVYADAHIHFDADDDGGPEIGCLECRQTARAGYGLTRTYMVFKLYCHECLEPIVRIDTLYGGIRI